MNARHLLAVSAMAVLVVPFALNAQGHTASVADHELHFFEAAEFGITPALMDWCKSKYYIVDAINEAALGGF